MSIIARLREQTTASTRLFGLITGERLSGKTTLSGTLPGRTLLIYPRLEEAGPSSSVRLATQLGNRVDPVAFQTIDGPEGLLAIVNEAKSMKEYDNIYIDGLTAIGNMTHDRDDVQAAIRKNIWDGYRLLGKIMSGYVFTFKDMTFGPTAKNVFITAALTVKRSDVDGSVLDVELECKGRVAISLFYAVSPIVLALRTFPPVEGEKQTARRLITKDWQGYKARVDGWLDNENIGIYEPDLGRLITIINEHRREL